MPGLLVPLLKIQKVHFSLMTNSSGEVADHFLTDNEVRSGSTEKMKPYD